MIEKVNPKHPDKIADRIAGALVDKAYKKQENPRVAIEVLIGHGECSIIIESSVEFSYQNDILPVVQRIVGDMIINLSRVKQNGELSKNQKNKIRCGDSGIYRGMPLTDEQRELSQIAREFYKEYDSDGKYIFDVKTGKLIICQSNAKSEDIKRDWPDATINPLGDWKGGLNVDTGATNRKLISDMADSISDGGLHGKDLSKPDVSVNIYAFLKAQETKQPVEICCAIGDEEIDGLPYEQIVEIARNYIREQGGFEKFAEWGLY